jgi:undecaprenyl-diphosphatase
MIDFTALGSVALLSLITCCSIGYLAAVRMYRLAGFVALSTVLGAVLSAGLKALLARPRPEIVPHLVEVNSLSFPSGHAMNSAIIYLTLAVLLARGQQRRSVQIYLISIAIALVLLVGSSRAYLGVHWPSDILAGWTIGAIWAALCSLVSRQLQRRRQLDGATDKWTIG